VLAQKIEKNGVACSSMPSVLRPSGKVTYLFLSSSLLMFHHDRNGLADQIEELLHLVTTLLLGLCFIAENAVLYYLRRQLMAESAPRLQDWNRERSSLWQSAASPSPSAPNGIACDQCGKILLDTFPGQILTSFPPKTAVHCTCGFRGFRSL
jgi:hypothetical protein